MTKIKSTDKVALLGLVVMGVTFPLSGQYVLQFLDWAFKEVFIYGSWVFAAAGLYVAVWMLAKVLKPEQTTSQPKRQPRVNLLRLRRRYARPSRI